MSWSQRIFCYPKQTLTAPGTISNALLFPDDQTKIVICMYFALHDSVPFAQF